jgi:NTE family protein
MAKRIGLALGAGSARGLSHIGVLRAFEDAGIKPAFVAGTSIGSMMGAAYCSGNLGKMETFMRTMTMRKMLAYCDFMLPRQALMEGDKIMNLIHELIPVSDFKDLQTPFKAVACDIHTGEQVILDSGDLHTAVRASISLPGIFLPVYSHGRWLVDGGLVNPVPVSVVREFDVDMVIAVDLNREVLDANGFKKDRKSKKKLLTERSKLLREKAIARKSGISEYSVPGRSSGVDDAEKKEESWITEALGSRYREMERSFKDTVNKWMDDDKKAKPEGPSIFDALAFSIDIMSVQITRRNFERSPADHVIVPEVGHLGLFDYDEAEPTIDDGYEKAQQLIHECDLKGYVS